MSKSDYVYSPTTPDAEILVAARRSTGDSQSSRVTATAPRTDTDNVSIAPSFADPPPAYTESADGTSSRHYGGYRYSSNSQSQQGSLVSPISTINRDISSSLVSAYPFTSRGTQNQVPIAPRDPLHAYKRKEGEYLANAPLQSEPESLRPDGASILAPELASDGASIMAPQVASPASSSSQPRLVRHSTSSSTSSSSTYRTSQTAMTGTSGSSHASTAASKAQVSLPVIISSKSSLLSSGFPFDSTLLYLDISPIIWLQISNSIVKASKLSVAQNTFAYGTGAFLELSGLTGSGVITGREIIRTQRARNLQKALTKDEGLGGMLKKWNEDMFIPKGLFLHLKIPSTRGKELEDDDAKVNVDKDAPSSPELDRKLSADTDSTAATTTPTDSPRPDPQKRQSSCSSSGFKGKGKEKAKSSTSVDSLSNTKDPEKKSWLQKVRDQRRYKLIISQYHGERAEDALEVTETASTGSAEVGLPEESVVPNMLELSSTRENAVVEAEGDIRPPSMELMGEKEDFVHVDVSTYGSDVMGSRDIRSNDSDEKPKLVQLPGEAGGGSYNLGSMPDDDHVQSEPIHVIRMSELEGDLAAAEIADNRIARGDENETEKDALTSNGHRPVDGAMIEPEGRLAPAI